jgi:hypothetical protein
LHLKQLKNSTGEEMYVNYLLLLIKCAEAKPVKPKILILSFGFIGF